MPTGTPTMTEEDHADLELLHQWQKGEAAAGNRLCRRYQDKLQRFFINKVPPHEVAELIQKTWLAMSQARRRVGADVVSVRGYLFGIARHMVIGYYARRSRMSDEDFDPEIESLESLEPSISRQLSLQRKVQWVELAVQRMPLELQILFEGHYLEEIPCVELAEVFGLPEGTVRSRLARARRLLSEARGDPRSGPTKQA